MVDDSTRPPGRHGAGDPVAGATRRGDRTEPDHDGPGMSFFSDDPEVVRAREQEPEGGTRVGPAFLGWLSAVGLTVVLVGVLAAVVGASGADPAVVGMPGRDVTTAGVVVAVVLLIVVFVSYLGGGYVAGRMVRADGWKQGLAVWVWAVVAAAVVGVVGLVAGPRSDVLARLDVLPRLPYTPDELSASGVVGAVLAVVVALVGAVLGGVVGARRDPS